MNSLQKSMALSKEQQERMLAWERGEVPDGVGESGMDEMKKKQNEMRKTHEVSSKEKMSAQKRQAERQQYMQQVKARKERARQEKEARRGKRKSAMAGAAGKSKGFQLTASQRIRNKKMLGIKSG